MRNLVTGSIVVALGFGITLFFLRRGEPGPPATSVVAESAGSNGPVRQLNEVLVRAPAAPATNKPAAGAPAIPAEAVPIPLGPEFEPLFETAAGMRAMHAAIEHEPREEPWASLMEGKWQKAFSDNPELLAYGAPEVQCRKTRCEIRLVTFRTARLDRMQWMQLIAKGAGQRLPGDQSPVLARRIANAMLGSVENDGATVILYNYEYERDPQPQP